jgi:hypothetical protein
MSKTRDTGYLANVIQVHDTGVRIMSGSTMLMAISSSGAVTITGEMSGSDAANALLLEGTGSLGFAAIDSFLAVSSSQQQISASLLNVVATSATTGSNTFTGAQYVSDTSNGIGFTSTASFYTDGGLRVGKNAYVSGTAYFNNIVVFGTSSIQYITSSQVNIGANIITVNTDTPAVRFGGLSVFDSGSTQLTGSMLWDSEKNHWVYSNPSGSSYSGGMLISGPRSSALGCEQGTTSCMLLVGQGGDHLTSSMIYHDSLKTCFYGNTFISSSGDACFAGQVCVGNASSAQRSLVVQAGSTNQAITFKNAAGGDATLYVCGTSTSSNYGFNTYACSDVIYITNAGRIGLGINNPNSQLHLKGEISFTEPGYNTCRIHSISHSHSDGLSSSNYISLNVSDGAGAGAVTAERMRINGSGALIVAGNVCACGTFLSNVGASTGTYGFMHCGASKWGRFGMPNNSYMYLETNADSGVYIDAQTRVAGYLCSSSNIQANALLFSTSICGSGTKLGTGGANTSYTPDGVWGGSATPNYISNASGGLFRLGYTDNGSGLYGPAYGFDVAYKDGLNRCIDYDAIMMRNSGQGTIPFRVTSYGNIYGLSKNFRIKHPIPSMNDTHYLVHTSIEGPQADLIYRGKVQLANGKAEVNIDLASKMTNGTFELLCQDVQSYTTNESGWSLTKSYIVENILHIEAQDETANDIISWLVIGERNDDGIKNSAITDENGHVIVEELKPEEGL